MDISAIILAAGQGKRLQKISQGKPKFLVQIKARPLLAYPLKIIEKSGINDVIIVVPGGWVNEAIQVLQELGAHNVRVIENNWFWRENGYSLFLALKHLYGKSDMVLISMVDHLYTTEMVSKIISSGANGEGLIIVGGDANPLYIDRGEATKILVNNNIIVDIGKNLATYNYVDVGVMAVKPQILHYIRNLVDKEEVLSLSKIIQTLGSLRKARVADVTGYYWTEIDTEEDYYELLSGRRTQVLRRVLGELGWD